jgi:hypothetical protein
MHGQQNIKMNFLLCFVSEVLSLEVDPSILDTPVQRVTVQKGASTCRVKSALLSSELKQNWDFFIHYSKAA